jgi:molybdopterin/thiamine biosynthesis adenylyltransferase
VPPPYISRTNSLGIGGFTIVDDKITNEEDIGVSFFLEESGIGRSRAEQTCSLINEMNADVKGEFVVQVNIPPCSLVLTTES